jgi:hypothetical protein
MGWRRGRRGTNSHYVVDYPPVAAADVSPRKLGDSRDCRGFIGSMLLHRGAQILLTSAATRSDAVAADVTRLSLLALTRDSAPTDVGDYERVTGNNGSM